MMVSGDKVLKLHGRQKRTNKSSSTPFRLGFYTLGDTGEIGIDYLLNGGAYWGELGIFSLYG